MASCPKENIKKKQMWSKETSVREWIKTPPPERGRTCTRRVEGGNPDAAFRAGDIYENEWK